MMNNGITIYYVEKIDQYGSWEPSGEAFLDEAKCRAFVLDLDISWIIEHVPAADIRRILIPHVTKRKLDQMSSEEIRAELIIVAKNKIHTIMENKELGGEYGGLHSYSTLTLRDGAES